MPRKKKQEKQEQQSGPSRPTQIKLESIAQKLGTSVEQLIEDYGAPETVIEKFDSGELQLLNE